MPGVMPIPGAPQDQAGPSSLRGQTTGNPHLFGVGLKEMLADEITADLRAIRDHAIRQAQRQGTPVTLLLHSKGLQYGSLTALPDGTVDTAQIEGVNPDLRVRPFFADGRRFSLRELTVVALRDAMGLKAQDSLTTAAAGGATVPTPSGLVLDGAVDTLVGPRSLGTTFLKV